MWAIDLTTVTAKVVHARGIFPSAALICCITDSASRANGPMGLWGATHEDPAAKRLPLVGWSTSICLRGDDRAFPPPLGGIDLLKRLKISERHEWKRRNNAQVYFQPPY